MHVHPHAEGAFDGEAATLHYDAEFLGGGHLGDDAARPGLKRVAVRGRRLDAVPGASELELVKIDAEGSEAAVWSGMSGLVAGPKLRMVILEWQPTCHPDPSAALAGFARAGFGDGLLDDGRGIVSVDAAMHAAWQRHDAGAAPLIAARAPGLRIGASAGV